MENLKSKWWALLVGILVGGWIEPVPVTGGDDAEWNRLNRKVETRRAELEATINEAKTSKLCTAYAEVSSQVISTFQQAARQDYHHMDEVRRIFRSFPHYPKIDPVHTERLPMTELEACINVADHALTELHQQLQGTLTRSIPPDFSTGTMKLESGIYHLDGQPVFPSSLVWLTRSEGLMQALGRMGGGYLQISQLNRNGTVDARTLNRMVESTAKQAAQNTAPIVYLMGHSPARWMKERYPEIVHGARNFTQYDIDHPQIRQWITALCEGTLPALSRACGDQPMVHLLANEPHFATRRGGWLARNGVSDHTMRKYHRWLAARYRTIGTLNQAYGTDYTRFDKLHFSAQTGDPVTSRQIDPRRRGGPVWYDWCRFNMDRVNDWFAFLKQQTQAHDGGRLAPVSIKTLGFTLSRDQRDGGIDIEYLTKLQDIVGADLRVAPRGAHFFGKHEEGMDPETGWQARYAYEWVEQSMFLDFSKSLCPDKLFYDSEWHGFGAVSWRHFNQDRDYVRSALWLAFSHGMGAIKPWVWGRDKNGALRGKADHIGELATQPIAVDAFGRTLKEINAHAAQVAASVPAKRNFLIYYCEEAAIQDPAYTAGFKQIYEALKLLNVTVGFTTPSEIGKLDVNTQAVVVSPTPFITDHSLATLRTFNQSGGRVIMVGAEQSFLKNEAGAARPEADIGKPYASLPLSPARTMMEDFGTALAPLVQARAIHVRVTDRSGKEAVGVLIQAARDPETGARTLLLNNISVDPRIITLAPGEKQTGTWTDLITRQVLPSSFGMESCGVRILRISPR